MVKRFVTLRNVQKGWNASRELRSLLAARQESGEEYTQGWLASEAGLSREQINGYVAGRMNLGSKNARRIAEALGVSLVELGAPEDEAEDAPSRSVLTRLEAAEEEAADLATALRAAKLANDQLRRRVAALEKAVAPLLEAQPATQSTRRGRTAA